MGVAGWTGHPCTVAGATGAFGMTGFTGHQGNPGYTGYTGGVGNDGATGYTGITGWTGRAGFRGPLGITGDNCETVGWTGSIGATGWTGTTGKRGPTGFTGQIQTSNVKNFHLIELVASDKNASNIFVDDPVIVTEDEHSGKLTIITLSANGSAGTPTNSSGISTNSSGADSNTSYLVFNIIVDDQIMPDIQVPVFNQRWSVYFNTIVLMTKSFTHSINVKWRVVGGNLSPIAKIDPVSHDSFDQMVLSLIY
jgi:hypothetical protein